MKRSINDRPFFDTNIILYAFSQNDPRGPIGETLLAAGGALSVQVLNEFAAVARRKLHKSWADVRRALDIVRVFCPEPAPVTARPTSALYTSPSDTGIRSSIHSSSRPPWILAPAHFTRRTCKTVRRLKGSQSAIHFHPERPGYARSRRGAGILPCPD